MTFQLSRRAWLAGGLACTAAVAARAEDGAVVTPAAWRADVDILDRAFCALHPGLLRYNTAAGIDAHVAALRGAVSRPTALGPAHLALARFAAQVRCGHTYVNPWNQVGASLALNSAGRTRLPFRFRWLAGRMVVTDGGGAHPALVPGAEVLRIGGVRPEALLRQLMPLAPADGANDAKRVSLMELRGEDEWELFDIYLPLLHPDLVAAGSARLQLRSPAGESRAIEVGLLSRAERAAAVKPGVVVKGAVDPAWRVERLAGDAAWLTMRSWALFDSKWDWNAALNADLDALAADAAPALIVDLRGNAGGLDVGDVILSRLVDRDLKKTDLRRFTRYRKTPAELDPYLKTWDRSFRDWGDQAVGPDARGFYRLTRYDDAPEGDLIRPRGRRFKGRVIVLTDASNSSATFGFAEACKTHGLATLVGETTGGSRRGINGGGFFFLRLPGSGLEIDLPLIGVFPSTPQPDVGVEPDVFVRTTAADIAQGVDRQCRVALALAAA